MAKSKDGRGRRDRRPQGKDGQPSSSLALQVNTVVASMVAMYTATHSVVLTVVSEVAVLVAVVTYLVTRREQDGREGPAGQDDSKEAGADDTGDGDNH
ncbi:hypothetical protein [Kineosporia sp. A_224]|uniref:hypothetical protein n=1 Tax=Kineosporia sp. A_224 TaxID=1962180 RepID=UPI00117B854B|nr:hypothetical protein [Kineosporia sp. A_224]